MSLSLWAGIGALTGFLFPYSDVLSRKVSAPELGAVYFGFTVLYGLVWAASIAARQLNDLRRAAYYRQYIENMLSGKEESPPMPDIATYWEGLRDFACVTKTLVTAGMLYISWTILF